MKEINLVELFSGIGGFALAFQNAGYTFSSHSFSEIDKHAIANYKYNFPHAKLIGSVTDVQGRELDNPNIITFGSPCQDFSSAGGKDGLKGKKSHLIMEAIRIITEAQPDVFIWENVKGAFSSNAGADFWAILKAFTDIGSYRLEWQLLNTRWILPQNRERIFLIGHLAGRSIRNVFPLTENDFIFKQQDKPIQGQSKTKVSSTITQKLRATQTYIITPRISNCITAGGNSGGLHSNMTTVKFNKPIQVNSSIESNDNQPYQQNRVYDIDGIAPALLSNMSSGTHAINLKNLGSSKRRGTIKENESQTLTTTNQIAIDANQRIRRLTEIESERLQGYPDNWTKYGAYDAEIKEISKTQRFKLLGNAITSTLFEKIAEKIEIKV